MTLRGELRLGRELLAVGEQAEPYPLADAERDLLRPAQRGQRGDERNRVRRQGAGTASGEGAATGSAATAPRPMVVDRYSCRT
jgi:hypothetical protein